MQTLTYNLRPGKLMSEKHDDPSFWAGLGALVVAVGGNAVALFLGLRNRKSEDRKSDTTLKLQAEEQEFDRERELWDRLRTLENDLNSERKTIIDLQRGQVALEGKLNSALSENENLRRSNEEREREYKAKQEMSDLVIGGLRVDLRAAQDELAGLRAQVESRSPIDADGDLT